MQTGGKIYFVDSVDVIKTRLSVGTSVKRTVCLLTGDIEAEDLQAIEVTGAKVITGMTLSQ
ncbi:MAG: hypothetical protein HGA80_06690, partial [Candidatus Omnitrophica bacterium]|nr:hypothetical protein [Candidatus Omnitrophota bacterium]